MNKKKLIAIMIVILTLVVLYFLYLRPTCEGPTENIATNDPVEVSGERYCAFGVKR